MYSFAGIEKKSYKLRSLGSASGRGSFEDFLRLRELSPKSKLMLSIGGWNESARKYSNMVLKRARREAFIESVMETMERYDKFDGVDFDWEYPGAVDRHGRAEDKKRFLALVRELRERFDRYRNSTTADSGQYKHGRPLELSLAVSVARSRVEDGYEVEELCQQVDFVNLLSFDLRGNWTGFADVHSPLYRRPIDDGGVLETLNVQNGSSLWHSLGCPKRKLLVGLAFYGRSFTLAGLASGLKAPTVAAGQPGSFTREAGFLSYYEICQNQSSWTNEYDSRGEVPFAHKANQWVGYENRKSLEIKLEWLKAQGYGGAMVWALDLDDFRGVCGKRYPLLRTVYKALKDYKVPSSGRLDRTTDTGTGTTTTTTTAATTTTTTTTTTTSTTTTSTTTEAPGTSSSTTTEATGGRKRGRKLQCSRLCACNSDEAIEQRSSDQVAMGTFERPNSLPYERLAGPDGASLSKELEVLDDE